MALGTSLVRYGRLTRTSLQGEGLGFLRLWPRVAQGVPGWLSAEEAQLLYALAHHGPGTGAVVEIGSAWGRSTIVLATGSKRAGREKVHAVDPHTGDPFYLAGVDPWWPPRPTSILGRDIAGTPWYLSREGSEDFSSLPGFLYNLRRFDVEDWVIPVVSESVPAAGVFNAAPIRLLFLDGLRTADGIATDIDAWVPSVAPGGIVVFADYQNQFHRAVDRLLASGVVDPRLRSIGRHAWTTKRT